MKFLTFILIINIVIAKELQQCIEFEGQPDLEMFYIKRTRVGYGFLFKSLSLTDRSTATIMDEDPIYIVTIHKKSFFDKNSIYQCFLNDISNEVRIKTNKNILIHIPFS